MKSLKCLVLVTCNLIVLNSFASEAKYLVKETKESQITQKDYPLLYAINSPDYVKKFNSMDVNEKINSLDDLIIGFEAYTRNPNINININQLKQEVQELIYALEGIEGADQTRLSLLYQEFDKVFPEIDED